jgi:hypothetical protein
LPTDDEKAEVAAINQELQDPESALHAPTKTKGKRSKPAFLDDGDESEGGEEPESEQHLPSAMATHEWNPEERANAHRWIVTAMLILFLVTAIKQNWWMHLRDWISEKTHGPSDTPTNKIGNAATSEVLKDIPPAVK